MKKLKLVSLAIAMACAAPSLQVVCSLTPISTLHSTEWWAVRLQLVLTAFTTIQPALYSWVKESILPSTGSWLTRHVALKMIIHCSLTMWTILLLHAKFKGKALAPVIPSFQYAYNKGKWSLQAGFALTGGGGKCTFDDGLGSFEKIVAETALAACQLAGAVDQVAASMVYLLFY